MKGLQYSVSELEQKLDKAKKDVKKYKELSKNPSIPQEKLDELKKEAEQAAAEDKAKEIEVAIQKTKEELSKAETARRDAEAAADKARMEMEQLRKQVLLADPAVTEFRAQYNTVQETMNKLISAYNSINDAGMQEKFKQAVDAMLKKYREEFKL